MIFDTDVLIWYFRGNEKARKIIHATPAISVSAVTLMELIQGMKNKQELTLLNKFITANQIKVFYINAEINLHAIYLLEEHALPDGLQLADALIAATALHYGDEILTANWKHYRPLPNLNVKKFIPV